MKKRWGVWQERECALFKKARKIKMFSNEARLFFADFRKKGVDQLVPTLEVRMFASFSDFANVYINFSLQWLFVQS